MDYKDISILFSVILTASFFLNIVFIIIAIPLGRYEIKHTQKAEFDPDRIVYYCYKHSKGYKFLVRFICVFAFLLHIPLFGPVIVFEITASMSVDSAFAMAILSILVIWVLSLVCYILSFKIGRDAPIKSFELTSKGLKIIPSNKKKPSVFYPIGCYKGYEPDLSKLVFADSKNNARSIPLKYLCNDDKISITGELAYLKNKGHLRNSKNDPIFADDVDEAVFSDSKVISSSKSTSPDVMPSKAKSAFKPVSVPVVEKVDAPSMPAPVKKEPVVNVKPVEKIINDSVILKDEVEPVEEKKSEEVSNATSRKASDPTIPDVSTLRSRIFIRNTYRTDILKVIDSYNDKHADDAIVSLSCDSYPGSAWMYIELKYDDPQDKDLIFWNSLDILKFIDVLNKDMFLYMEGVEGSIVFNDNETREDNFKMILSGNMFMIDITKQKIDLLHSDASFDDIKSYIKDKYRLDV